MAAPIWGTAITCGRDNNLFCGFGGSSLKASSAAALKWPLFKLSYKAPSSTRSPLAVFINIAPFFIFASDLLFIIFTVSLKTGICSEIKSEDVKILSVSAYTISCLLAKTASKFIS